MSKRILIGCEFSGVVREAFRKLGFDAWSCDLLRAKDESKYHFQEDIFEVLKRDSKWDLFIGHPPCTYLCNSGVRWLEMGPPIFEIGQIDFLVKRWNKVDKRRDDMKDGANFFKKLLDLPIVRICIENPIPHRYALDIIGRKYDQIIQPYMFGDPFQKSTCLWLKNLPKLVPTNIVSKGKMQVCKSGKVIPEWYSNNKKLRSITFPGIARAFAEQYGKLL